MCICSPRRRGWRRGSTTATRPASRSAWDFGQNSECCSLSRSDIPRRYNGEKMQLSNNTVLITGGGTGIGYAMAEAFLEAGSTVAICGRKIEQLLEARAKHPEFYTRACDIANARRRQPTRRNVQLHFAREASPGRSSVTTDPQDGG